MAIFSDNSVGGIIDKFNNSDTPQNGDVMTYNGSTGKWEATAPASSSGGGTVVATGITTKSVATQTGPIIHNFSVSGAVDTDVVLATLKTSPGDWHITGAYVSGAWVYVELSTTQSIGTAGAVTIAYAILRP